MCDARKLGLVVIGDHGSLGRGLLHALDTSSQAEFCGASVHIAAIGGDRGYIKHPHGLSWDHIRTLLNHTTIFHGSGLQQGDVTVAHRPMDDETSEQVEVDADDDGDDFQRRDKLRDVLGDLAAFGHYDKFIVVDCTSTASPSHVEDLALAKSLGMGLVLANIHVVAGPWATYASLVLDTTTKTKQSSLVAFEATVGKGLPVLSTIRRLQASGDHVTLVHGTFSDAVGHVLAEMEAMTKTGTCRAEFKAKGADAKANGNKLVFVAKISDGGGQVRIGLQSVDHTHSLHASQHGDSVVEIQTTNFPHGILVQVAKPDATGTVAAIVADIASLSCILFRRCNIP
ncbi:hypothetical protein B5M09_000310 [Aphanomyces astaci]|uniref:Homoserine dehydrogenase n=1 Tax=Aphanomyces astaci TaxID=112090 RepID=A0A3R7YIM4_APHAT|nr:hypothetical protein B5M09_000310 [Aphanomyces astaci]